MMDTRPLVSPPPEDPSRLDRPAPDRRPRLHGLRPNVTAAVVVGGET